MRKRKRTTNNLSRPNFLLSFIFIFFLVIPLYGQDIPNRDKLLKENAAKKLLKQAQSYQANGELNKAVKELIVITDYYPGYSQIGVVFIVLGDVLTEMELYSAASKIYRHILSTYSTSAAVPFALYGLEKIYYLQEKYNQSLVLYGQLQKEHASAKVGSGKHYYAGESFLALDDFDNAILAFGKIENSSEFKGYALYSSAMAKLKKKIFLRLLTT